uniref:Uncharacterized protein n=1 Tax=Oryza sativa subsp. japonica TaxID=39947 RepID=Q2R1M1_ORYSJ|nr:hypothetical protein LOC_Os11g38734 [Oryza sativa Japonica Group]
MASRQLQGKALQAAGGAIADIGCWMRGSGTE